MTDQEMLDNYFNKKPFNEEVGIRGNVTPGAQRQIFVSPGVETGGVGSSNIQPQRYPLPVSEGGGGDGGGSGVITGIILAFNGTAYYCDLNGAIKGPV